MTNGLKEIVFMPNDTGTATEPTGDRLVDVLRDQEARWQAVAVDGGQVEFQEIENRIQNLKSELAATPAWDGDTQDDTNRALLFFKSLLAYRPADTTATGQQRTLNFLWN